MLLQTKQRNIAIEDLNRKLRLENIFSNELRPIFNRINRDFRTTYAGTGRILDFSNYQPDVSTVLRRHYERTQRVFRGRIAEQNEKMIQSLQIKQTEDEETLIGLGLLNWLNLRLETQPQVIIDTTDREARMAVEQARQDLIEQNEEVTPVSLAIGSSVINRRRLMGRIPGISITETQAAAESTKQIEAEVLSGRMPFTAPIDPFALTRPRRVEIAPSTKQWITVADDRVRPSHVAADRQTVPIDDAFIVGGAQMRHPGDITLGAPIQEWINCRCSSNINIEGF